MLVNKSNLQLTVLALYTNGKYISKSRRLWTRFCAASRGSGMVLAYGGIQQVAGISDVADFSGGRVSTSGFCSEKEKTEVMFSKHLISALAVTTAVLLFVSASVSAPAQTPKFSFPFFDAAKSSQRPSQYQPNQVCPPRPKVDFTDESKPILIKRYPRNNRQTLLHFRKYPYYANTYGVEHAQRGTRLKREPENVLSEDQKAILREWGQPDYLRGPYRSTRGDSVVEWVYHKLNHLFQFVDGVMVYEGPLTDQERVVLTYGLPRETLSSTIAPNIKRETWFYNSPWQPNKEMVFSFANGKLVFSDENYSY